MKLWFIIELLLFFVLLAFASARSVAKQENVTTPELVVAVVEPDELEVELTTVAPVAPVVSEAVENITDPNSPSRFCKCAKLECNCCREFRLPVLPISSAGCASLQYLKGDKMALTMRLGDAVIRNITISARKNKPACVNLPGGFSQFCGRVYGISRQDETFRACLGLELRALADLEASLRVSCFRFSPTGVTMEPAPPLPPNPVEEEDDDDDFFGFGGLDEEDEDEDDEDGGIFGDDDEEYKDNDPAENDVSDEAEEGEDYPGLLGTFGSFFDTFFEEDTTTGNKKKKKPTAIKKPVESPAPAVLNDKIDLIVEEKPDVKNTSESLTIKPIKTEFTTERHPTTIVLSPTSSVTVTMSESTTKRAEIPDPIKQSEETKEEEDEEEEDDDISEDFDIELDDDDDDDDEEEEDDTTEGTDSESFSSELAEAIKGVEEEVSSLADIEVEDASDEDESTGKPSAVAEVSSTTEAEDEELDILEAVEELAEEVSGTDKDEPPPQIGVAMNGEPRGNATKEAENKDKTTPTTLKRTHRRMHFEEDSTSGNKKKKKPTK